MFLNFVSRTIIKRDMLNFVSKECDAQNGNCFKNGGKVTPLVGFQKTGQIIDENDSLDVGDVD